VQISLQDTKTQDWISITGKASVHGNDDPRVEELYGPSLAAWFGDLGDGKHNATKDDPRIALTEVKTTFVSYWKSKVGTLGGDQGGCRCGHDGQGCRYGGFEAVDGQVYRAGQKGGIGETGGRWGCK
jgi:Pyridoxamine 5'-phosphate oxidase like